MLKYDSIEKNEMEVNMMKNKKTIILSIVTLLILLVACSFIFLNARTPKEPEIPVMQKAAFTPFSFQPKILPEEDTQMGTFHFPKEGISVPLIYGYNDAYMNQFFDEVGLEAWGNLPGEENKIYINGHRHLAFQSLKNIVVGDKIILETDYGIFTYEVTVEPQIVLASDEEAIKFYTDDHDKTFSPQILRLQTCYPFPAGSTLDHRYLVDLALVESEYKIA